MNLEGLPAVSFSLKEAEGKICSDKDFAGHWLLMVFHRHLG